MNLEQTKAKLSWACRRGMLELDIILNNYLDNYYLTADVSERQAFERLLSCTDQELYEWLVTKNKLPNDETLAIAVKLIISVDNA